MLLRQYKGEEIPYHDACVLEILAIDNTRKLIRELEEYVHHEPMSLRKLRHKTCLSNNVLTYLISLDPYLYVDNRDIVRYREDIDE